MNLRTIASILSVSVLSILAAEPSRLLPFQGRIVSANGQMLPDGVRLIRFQIYDDSVNATNLVWAAEYHRVTINGGLINVVLGTKTTFNGVDFNRPLFFEMTVDSGGSGGEPDGAITDLDPALRPRQAILPVIFASEAANARLLGGHG